MNDIDDNKLRGSLKAANFPEFEKPDFNEILHYLRGCELDALPKVEGSEFLSVGCAGTWYFDWIEEHCGPLGRHIGIEFYSPKPEDLPSNVVWIANTAGNLSDVGNASADVLFSGQNIEHLWPHDVVGFLLESHRVLRTQGLLVIDSPNRLVTCATKWSHPEHTIEFTPEEAIELIELAGFEIESLRGLWRCIDDSGKVLGVAPTLDETPKQIQWRVESAAQHPEDSFVWWINARRSQKRVPDPEVLKNRTQEVFSANWPERVRRMTTIVGKQKPGNIFTQDGESGMLMFGPYMPLPAGNYTISIEIKNEMEDPRSSDIMVAVCDVVSGNGEVLSKKEVFAKDFGAGRNEVQMSFVLNDMTFGLQFRVLALGKNEISVYGDVSLASHDDLLLSVV